jgi:hypothetical protein
MKEFSFCLWSELPSAAECPIVVGLNLMLIQSWGFDYGNGFYWYFLTQIEIIRKRTELPL